MAKTADPYKKVWDDNVEEVSNEWNQNSTLFAPNYDDMANRMISKSKYHLRMARKYKGTPQAEVEFENAMAYRNVAAAMSKRNQEILAKSR